MQNCLHFPANSTTHVPPFTNWICRINHANYWVYTTPHFPAENRFMSFLWCTFRAPIGFTLQSGPCPNDMMFEALAHLATRMNINSWIFFSLIFILLKIWSSLATQIDHSEADITIRHTLEIKRGLFSLSKAMRLKLLKPVIVVLRFHQLLIKDQAHFASWQSQSRWDEVSICWQKTPNSAAKEVI